MNPWTPDAMHHIASDRRRDALTAAETRRRSHSRRPLRSLTQRLSAGLHVLRRRRAIEVPHPTPLHTTPPA